MQQDHSTLIIFMVIVVLVLVVRALIKRAIVGDTSIPTGTAKPPVLVRTYKGSPESAGRAFHAQAVEMAAGLLPCLAVLYAWLVHLR